MKAAYVHIPFCDSICSYCDFSKVFYREEQVNQYLDTLEREIEKYYEGDLLKTLYIGGGTPSSLNVVQLKRFLEMMSTFQLDKDYEYTFEANPENINLEKLELLTEYGVNRLSIGIQTFNERLLKIINRKHNTNDVFNALEAAKKVGITNINVDLLFSLPTQTIDELNEDLLMFSKLDVPHISAYSLILEDHTVFKVKDIELQEEEVELAMYELVINTLNDNGLKQYEISNYSKEGFESKHNLTYWDNSEYYGFGLGAHGYVHGIRYGNTRSFKDYFQDEYRVEEHQLSKNEMMEEEMFLGLRKMQGVDVELFKQKYSIDIKDLYPFIDEMVDSGLLFLEDGYLKLTHNGLMVGNSVFEKFLIDSE